MKEIEFIKEYQKKRKLGSAAVAKEKIEAFWETMMECLEVEEENIFENWGTFKVKEVRKNSSNNSRIKNRNKEEKII